MTEQPAYDFAILGAGVIGTSTAYHLKRLLPNCRILVIDRERRPGSGNTARSTALFRNIFSSSTSRDLTASSIEFYQSLGKDIQCKTNGYLWLFSDEQWDELAPARRTLNDKESGIEELSGDRIHDLFPINTEPKDVLPNIGHGLFGHRCGSLSPIALTQFYADGFSAMGGEIRLSTDVVAIELNNRSTMHAPWSQDSGVSALVDKAGTRIRAEKYIFAAGAWTQQVLGKIGVYTGVLPKKRQLFGLHVDNRRHFVRSDTVAPIVILPAGGVHIKPVLERNLLIVGMASDLGVPFEIGDNEASEENYNQGIRPVLAHYFPALGNAPIQVKWAGYYAYHWPDQNPVIESEANLMWVSGTSGSGIMKADALGRIAAAKALGTETAELFDGATFRVADLSLRNRQVDTELFVI